MRVWSLCLILFFLGTALAGCIADEPDVGPDVEAPEDPVPPALEFLCGPEATTTGDLCHHRITSRTETNQEPFIALHRTDPDIMAIGVNAGHTVEGLVLDSDHPGFDMVRMDIFFTEDGGATWTRSTLPYVRDPAVTLEPFQSSVVGDPALEFDTNGTLHVSGIASHSQLMGYNVFYTSTPDLGRSWTEPVVLSTGDDNDRNWLNIGPDGTIFVPWQRVGTLSEVAISHDGGATWTIQARDQVADDCITVSEVVYFLEDPYMACSREIQNEYAVHLFRIDPETADLNETAVLTDMPCVWPKLVVARETLVITGEFCPGDLYTTTTDLIDFTEPQGIDRLTGRTGAIMWITDDPWGRIHTIQTGHYSMVDLAEGAANATSYALPANAFPTHTESIAPAYGDHYWGLDVKEHGGALVWTRDDNLDWARLVPVP